MSKKVTILGQVKQDASRFARVPAVYVHAMLTCELVAFLISSPDKWH